MHSVEGTASQVTLYLGSSLEKITSSVTGTSYRHTISANGAPVALLTRTSSGVDTLRYLLGDHQGSVEKITTSAGNIEARESFAAFGGRRNALTWDGNLSGSEGTALDAITPQGYTYHTALTPFALTEVAPLF